MEFIFNKNVLWNLSSTKTFYGIYLQRKRVLRHISQTKTRFIQFILNENELCGIYLQRTESDSLKLHAMSDATPGTPASYLNLHT
jgi:hypothetical protein